MHEDKAMNRVMLLVGLWMCLSLTGCGTVGGLVSGAGQDLQKAGDWMRKK
jgi:hypothetical protein